MTSLSFHDLQFALLRTPKQLLEVMKRPEWAGKIFVGGGFLRSIVAGDDINDIDVFVTNDNDAHKLSNELVLSSGELSSDNRSKLSWVTDNAITVKCFKPCIQIIHRWTFDNALQVSDSFDFTCCCAAFWWGQPHYAPGTLHDAALREPQWHSVCDERFYCDVAAKRLIYRNPVRNEDAGGSMLRVLKYYQKGYRIPLDSLADVITRLVQGVDFNKLMPSLDGESSAQLAADNAPRAFSRIICGLLREVDPSIDPSHIAHLPAESTREPLDGRQ